MNYFFGIDNNNFSSEIQIPLFKNDGLTSNKIKLFSCKPINNKWEVKEVNERKIKNDFYILKSHEDTNSEIYFLAHENSLIGYNHIKLEDFDNFTNTFPSYRANLKILLKSKGGFSSYQSEYPYSMVNKKGTILSSVNSIANKDAEKNYILIKNIFEIPLIEKFNVYLVNVKLRKIEETFSIKTNYTNCIELNNLLIKPEIFLVTNDFLGVPIYVSTNDKHISFEHTHPPHEYILSKNRYQKVSELKKDINEIIN
tara:strand:+ start:7 stop:771 length:765 start_codon:yes stop_codon:yes gene_type:complete